VELTYDCPNEIYPSLKELIRIKSKRDGVAFTTYQLAKLLNVPHSLVVRLVHPDPEKRVTNPRVETLTKIVEFFKADGFNITIDDLIAGLHLKKVNDIQTQEVGTLTNEKNVTVYSFEAKAQEKMGVMNIRLQSNSRNIIALLSDEDIKPLFKKGSVFIIDTKMKPENDMLIAVKIEDYDKILIRKFYLENKQIILKPYTGMAKPILLTPKMHYSILGVVIQVNAKN
jgi:hypothetical protein